MRASQRLQSALLIVSAAAASAGAASACSGASESSSAAADAPDAPGAAVDADAGSPDGTTSVDASLPDADATASAETAPPDAGGTVVRLIHYNDLHAHLVTHPTLIGAPDGQVPATPTIAERGGIARVATVIKQLRAEVPGSLLMNIGDTFHGGVEALYTQGEAVAAAVNALGIDVGVPGNWDYAYGPAITRLRYTGSSTTGMLQCVQAGFAQGTGPGSKGDAGVPSVPTLTPPNFPNLAANVTYASGPGASPGDPFLPATLLKEISGVKIGFIGLSSDIVPRMHPMLGCGLTFLGAAELANGDAAGWTSKYQSMVQLHAANLRGAGAQVVVVMSELGLQKNYYLANALPAGTVDVVFSAHTHEAVFTPLTSKSGALVVEDGDDTYVGRMDLRVLGGKVVDRQWKLLPVTSAVVEDATVKALVDKARAPFLLTDPNLLIPGNTGAQYALHQPISTVVGKAPHPLTRKNALESTFNDFFAEALRTRAGTQLAMAPGFRFDAPIATSSSAVEGTIVADGSVTLEDAFRFFPVVYKMGLANVGGGQLDTVVEGALDDVFSTNVALQSGGWVEGFAGFHASVNLANGKGSRVLGLTLADGSTLSTAGTFTIAGCRRPYDPAGVLCSHDGFTNVTDFLKSDGSGEAWTDVEIFLDGLARASSLAPKTVFNDSSGTKLWPASPWVQPLAGATGP